MTARLYKWLLPGLVTPVQTKPWPVKPGQWTTPETPILCRWARYSNWLVVRLESDY